MSASNPTRPACAIVRSSFEDYLRDALPAPQRRMLRDHLAECADCRAAAAASDPTFRFARPLATEVSDGETREILSAVRTGVDLLRAERRLGGRSRRLRIGSTAAAAVAAAVLVSSGWGILRSPSVPPASAAGSAAEAPERLQSPVPPSGPEASSAGLQPVGLGVADTEPEPSASAASSSTVYDWNPGAGREEPRVVWIVDRGLDI